MGNGAIIPHFELDVAGIHARSAADLSVELSLARQRVAEAERAQVEAQRAQVEAQRAQVEAQRAQVEAQRAQAQLQAEVDELSAAKKELWKEKTALAKENDLLLKRLAMCVRQLAEAVGSDKQLKLAGEISNLQRQLDERNRSLYGTSSERRLPSDGSKRPDKKKKRKAPKRSGSRRTNQKQLTIESVHHKLEPEQTEAGCKGCQGDLVKMAGQTEDSEEVDIHRVRYVLKAHKRQKYRCNGCGGIATAPGPKKLIAGGRYSPAFAVQVAVDKYSDALPLDRQVHRMRREGLTVTSQTLWDQLTYLYLLLLPTLLVLHDRVLAAEVCVADETPWRMMDNKGGGTKRWWLWVLSDGIGTYFQLVTSRGAAAARNLLHDFAGMLVTDDYIVYTALEKERTRKGGVQQILDEDGELVDRWTPDFTLATCWMHARRYFIKAEKYHVEAGPVLDIIDELYQIEDDAKAEVAARCEKSETEVSAKDAYPWLLEARRRLRDARSRDCIAQLDDCRKALVRLEGTALAEAIDHLDRLWSRLILFLDDPRIPLDSGHAEREIRRPVVGRKNYQGCRSEFGARVAALFFSLISTAKNLGLDPNAYLLAAVNNALAEKGTVTTPWDYADQLRTDAKRTQDEAGED
jgi:transposase